MEKRVLLAIGLTIGAYLVYFTWFLPKPQPARAPVVQGTAPAAATTRGREEPGPAPAPGPAPRAPVEGGAEGPDETADNGSLALTIASRGGAVRTADAWSCLYHARDDVAEEGDPGRPTVWADGVPGALAVDLLGPGAPDLAASPWRLSRAGDAVRAEIESEGLLLWKEVRISDDPAHPWHADVTVGVRNVSAKAGAVRTLEVAGPVMPPPNPAFPDDGLLVEAAGEDAENLTVAAVLEQLAENPRLEKRPTTGKWGFVGVRADFHVAALVPVGDLPRETTVAFRPGSDVGTQRPPQHVRQRGAGSGSEGDATPAGPPRPTAAAVFRLPVAVPDEGGETTFRFRFFAGPNSRSLFTEEGSPYAPLQGLTINRTFLWMSFRPLARLLAWLLEVIASTGMGYGLAVIALTIVVRGALFPISRKSQISMRLHGVRMQRLKPKLDAIKEKHKDPKKQQELTMKLFREEKVSLLPGGCWLAFLQMPIWISLWSVLQTTFEMRHAGFLWAEDLTAPDHLVHLPFLAGVPFVPETVNLLPILMMATWTYSSFMTPLPADPQQAQQAKMMRWMPVLFGFFLYSTASGLTLYMTASAVWSIGETALIKKVWLAKIDQTLA